MDVPSWMIAKVYNEISILDLFQSVGVHLQETSEEGQYRGLCPFHNDHSPSLSVNSKNNVFYCFGCSNSGGVPQFYMARYGLSFEDAVRRSYSEHFGETTSGSANQGGDPVHDFTTVPLDKLRAGRFLDKEPPPLTWLIEGALLLGVLGLIIANGGVGKGFFLLQLAMSMAAGFPFLNDFFKIGTQGKVIYFLAEDSDIVIHHRIHSILKTLISEESSPDVLTRLNDNLFLQSLNGHDARLMKNLNGNPECTDIYESLRSKLCEIDDLALVILDPASRFRCDNEINPSLSTLFASLLERIAKDTGATVLMAHHTHKGAGRGLKSLIQEMIRGDTGLTNAARFQLGLTLPDIPDIKGTGIPPKEIENYVIGKVVKSNMGPLGTPFFLRRNENGVLNYVKVDESKMDIDQKVLEAVIKKIIELEPEKRMTTTDFTKTFAGVFFNYGRDRLRGVIDKAILSGDLITITTKNKRNRTIEVLSVPSS